jgi:hypothetical protein
MPKGINVAGESIENVDKGCSGVSPSDGGFLHTQHPTVYRARGTPVPLHLEGESHGLEKSSGASAPRRVRNAPIGEKLWAVKREATH